jgi:hypothetical protein
VERNSMLLQPRRSPGRERAAEAASSQFEVWYTGAAEYSDDTHTTDPRTSALRTQPRPPETELCECPVVLLK